MTLTFHRRIIFTLFLLVVCLRPSAQAAEPAVENNAGFYLKNGDRVVFYGDSITDQRLYTTFVETYVVTRFPTLDATFIHSGWGGDRVSGGKTSGDIDTRLSRDVYAYKPTVMTVMLGMNDGRYRAFDQELFDTYRNGLASIVEKARRELPGMRLTLIRPSPYDEVTRGPSEKVPSGYNDVMIRFGEAVKSIADANRQTVVDFNAPITEMLTKAKAADAALAEKIIPDRVHPQAAGHLIMAAQLLGAWNAPALVTNVAIDASARKVVRSENSRVSALTVSAGTLSWTQLDGALPLPVDMTDAVIALAVRSSDLVEKLNRQPLCVTGLAEGNYDLFIDGQRAGGFTAAQLAAGINLAVLETPMTAQAAEVHKLTIQHTALHQTRWRAFQVPYAAAADPLKKHLPDVMNALDTAEDAAVAMQRAAARPVERRYELKPVSAGK
jgi:lysophospholipase L1-like esterase